MTYKGYSIRASLAGGTGFPGDGAGDTWCGTAAYVSSAGGGAGYGWDSAGPSLSNTNSPSDARIAGSVTINGSSPTFRFDVPKGPVDVRLGLGNGSNNVRLRYGPGSTSGTDYSDINGTTSSGVNVTDATGAVFTNPAAWEAGNTPLRVSNIVGYLQLEKNPSGFSKPQYVSYQLASTALADCTFTDEAGVAGAPTLFESQVAGKYIGQIIQSIGGSPATSLGVFESDGVTPSLYLSIQVINGQYWLVQTATRMPNLSGTYSFKLIQTDITGQAVYTNSPYVQSLSWTVVPAPTKPYNDGTFFSKISTGAFLLRKKVVDVFNQPYNPTTMMGEWLGYQGGLINNATTVKTTAAFNTAINGYITLAATAHNTTYCIEIDSDGTSDWATHEVGATQAWDFFPENGNVCLIRYKAGGNRPLLVGGWACSVLRGVHVVGLTAGMDHSATTAAGGAAVANSFIQFNNGTNARLTILRVEQCLLGLMFNPAYAGSTPDTIDATKLCGAVGCVSNGTFGEQLIIKDCAIWGSAGFTTFGFRMVRISNVDGALFSDDFVGSEIIPLEALSHGMPDLISYEWIDRCHLRNVVNSNPNGVHADYNQQRILFNGTKDPGNMTNRLWENSTCSLNFSWTGSPSIQRNVFIVSDTLNLSACFLNNILANDAQRGIDTGCGTGISYCEYNTLGIPSIMPTNATTTGQTIESSNGGVVKHRKNVFAGASGEGNVGYSVLTAGGVDPNTIMTGPFIHDPGLTSRWMAQNLQEDIATYSLAQYLAFMQSTYSSPSFDAGFQANGLQIGAGRLPLLFP